MTTGLRQRRGLNMMSGGRLTVRFTRQVGCVVTTMLLIAPAGIAADTQGQSGSTGRTLLAPVSQAKNPYGRLFLLPGQKTSATAPRLKAAPAMAGDATALRPTVVCGTRLVPIDPSIDPGIRRLPDAGAPRPAVRTVEPPLCR